MRYIVTEFSVKKNFDESREPIWEGEAVSKEDAIDKASKLWSEDMQQFMKGYLQAHIPDLN